MYSAYLDMLEPIYQHYYDDKGCCKTPNATKDKIYHYLTAEPPQQGNLYFDQVPEPQERSFLDIAEEPSITRNVQGYYHVYPGTQSPQGPYLVARVVANISSQTAAIDAALKLWGYCQSRETFAQSVYQYKILLGSEANLNPVKLDKIVIYNRVPNPPRGGLSVISHLKDQMRFLSGFCSPGASVPHFVWQPSSHSPVGLGEGIAYNMQDMTFSEPRADCLFNIIAKTREGQTPLINFLDLLSKEFEKTGLSKNIPFINKCKTKEDEKKWLIS